MRKLFRKKAVNAILETDEPYHVAENSANKSLEKILTVKDLTFMGIAAVVGAGIFSTIGSAAYLGGPAISLLFVVMAFTCGFSALCYAEFASRVPIAGSAYTYAYVSFGELIAWIIGWALILEYAIGNIVVAISWSGYFNNLLQGIGMHLPEWLVADYYTIKELVTEAIETQTKGNKLTPPMENALLVWQNAPTISGIRLILNVPAFMIVMFITWLAYIGIKESKKMTNFMVVFKICVIVLVIVVGAFYIHVDNWVPFMPNGFEGVLAGVSAVFYAYIGFDAISTTAEECKNPQRDLPRGMIFSLIICTILYILIALVLTGMVNYTHLKVNDPLAFVFELTGNKWIGYIISVSAVIATTSVLLVFQLGQPRIWMTMSRDGLLPPIFNKVHPKFKTPSFSTILTGFFVGIPSLFLPSSLMTDLTSIGTLFAFVLVCFGVLVLPTSAVNLQKDAFKLPYINGKWIVPALALFFLWFSMAKIENILSQFEKIKFSDALFLVFMLLLITLSVLSFLYSFSSIPIIGGTCCLYLLTEIHPLSWIWFFCWMGIGLVIYFGYGRKKSKLSTGE